MISNLITNIEYNLLIIINNEEKNKLNIIATKVLKNFHKSFGEKSVRDDYSKPLEIIVMKNKDHYHRYGNYPFRIDTNVLKNFGQKYNEEFYYWLNKQSNHLMNINRYSNHG
ncbi:hypothetical protein CS369_05305 [Candidatus Symbiopectobacterium sp. 'North America']|nr:hypothetical protein [Candidatus Symbiopectobacterium sp. 'North America']